ncbi:hypothetical protein [Microbacterium sp.]|uniref:hypothetical protein n=1 Tax=Microbacterium sp. TaxID=51671 RepID=UPI002604E4F7|nr:hypothetical protein [Microbacterium sp.]
MLSTLSDRASTVSPLPLCTLDDARHLGINLRSGWARVRKGIYVNSDAYDKLSARDKYAVRVHAFIRMNPDAVLCLESAAVIHGVPQFGETKDIHVFDPHRTSSWRHSDVSVHTSKDPRTIERVNGVLVTSLVDTVCDLVRVVSPGRGIAIVDTVTSPAQGGLLSIGQLQDHAADQQNQRGRARMQLVWAHADPLSESPVESLSRAVIAWSGFEVPVLQREFIYEGQCDRVDFYFESVRAIGEADGWGKYDLMNNDDPMAKLKDEKRREDRLRRHRHPFARWEMRDIWSVKPLTAKLVEIGVPRVAPKHDALLITFRNNPRAKPWKKGG